MIGTPFDSRVVGRRTITPGRASDLALAAVEAVIKASLPNQDAEVKRQEPTLLLIPTLDPDALYFSVFTTCRTALDSRIQSEDALTYLVAHVMGAIGGRVEAVWDDPDRDDRMRIVVALRPRNPYQPQLEVTLSKNPSRPESSRYTAFITFNGATFIGPAKPTAAQAFRSVNKVFLGARREARWVKYVEPRGSWHNYAED